MKKQYLLMIVAVILFAGGFFSGVLFSNIERQNQTNDQSKQTENLSKSIKQPHLKKIPDVKESKPKVLIGYVQDFRDPETIDFSSLTHVVYSFAHPTKDGSILLNGGTEPTNLKKLVKRAHNHDTKVLLAVGGWYHIEGGESYDYFKTAISSETSRTKLINELLAIVDREQLDGIDIDFEHPRSQEDADQLLEFTKQLSNKLHQKKKQLTIAVYSKIHSVAGTEIQSVVFHPEMFTYVDYVNIMAYDGQWDGEYNAANLAPYSFIENIVKYWGVLFDSNKLPREKLVLGVPYYAQPEDPSIKQMSFGAIIANNPKFAHQDAAQVNGTTYHYNGIPTIEKKTMLAIDQEFGGMMIWEMGHDASGDYSLTTVISQLLEDEKLLVREE
ncbi:glycosyl hydrolase family 18 protein [Metabacillus litoralis]|uniref:glycosyl hydrolase family 18 protein n=1 Tax=Metabacillus litoralis TaxID=152268 RepID=UPI000EF6260D|nr:glycosyl hydrolase family 18 protein [Metabacillus litoralis]